MRLDNLRARPVDESPIGTHNGAVVLQHSRVAAGKISRIRIRAGNDLCARLIDITVTSRIVPNDGRAVRERTRLRIDAGNDRRSLPIDIAVAVRIVLYRCQPLRKMPRRPIMPGQKTSVEINKRPRFIRPTHARKAFAIGVQFALLNGNDDMPVRVVGAVAIVLLIVDDKAPFLRVADPLVRDRNRDRTVRAQNAALFFIRHMDKARAVKANLIVNRRHDNVPRRIEDGALLSRMDDDQTVYDLGFFLLLARDYHGVDDIPKNTGLGVVPRQQKHRR